MLTDATTAKAIAARRGLGKIRHLDVAQLWVQQMVSDGSLEVVKIKNDFNSADLFTKHLGRVTMDKCIDLLGHTFATGRSAIAPALNMLRRTKVIVATGNHWQLLLLGTGVVVDEPNGASGAEGNASDWDDPMGNPVANGCRDYDSDSDEDA